MTPKEILFAKIEKEIRNFKEEFLNLQEFGAPSPFEQQEWAIFEKYTAELNPDEKKLIEQELFGLGPLDRLLENEDITEVLVQNPQNIWIEQTGNLSLSKEAFLSSSSYERIFERVCREAQTHISLDRPFVSTKFRSHRLSLVHKCLSQSEPQMSFRRHRQSSWTLEEFKSRGWSQPQDVELLREIILKKLNFLVVGATGSGKTSLLNALLKEVPEEERIIVIEDTHELCLPNALSTRLLAREGMDSGLSEIRPSELLKYSLRLRPDRLVMGEIRGEEAKDFLLLLSTGHRGSFGTLHAESSQQALMRLEMLIQMGAPHWSIETVRRLIHECLQIVIVVEKRPDGHRQLKEITKIQSLEPFGFTTERLNLPSSLRSEMSPSSME